MLEEVDAYLYDKYIKGLVIEENGVKKISKEELDKLQLSPNERNLIIYIINKKKIELIEEKITKEDRSPYVRDNNYGEIQTFELQKNDEPNMSKIEYSKANEKIYEDYNELDEYLETRFIPAYVLLKQRKNSKGEIERFPSIRLHHIMALRLSEAELEHVMNYLKEKNIRVGGKGATLDGEFDNYDYVTTYKDSALPLNTTSSDTLQKIKLYKQNHDQKLRNEIITDNMRLVPYVAYRYTISTGIDHHELESYGYEGLMLALEKFDVNYGCSFSTYAIAHIRGQILRGIQEILNGKSYQFYYDYVNAIAAVEKENGVTLSEEPELVEDVIELLVATGKVKDTDDSIEYARRKIISMAIGASSLDDEEVVEELIADGQLVDDHDYVEDVLNTMTRDAIDKVLSTLKPREAEVLRLRFGLYDGKVRTQAETGKILGVSGTRIYAIESKAIRKLQHQYRAKFLKDFVDDPEIKKHGR